MFWCLVMFKFLILAGIDVGHRFYSRAEMVAVGFHGHWLNGIDYMGASYRKGVKHLSFSLISISRDGSLIFLSKNFVLC